MDFGLAIQQSLIDLIDIIEYQIISLRYIENFNVKDIAQTLNMTEAEVIRILKKAIYLYKLERLNSIKEKTLDDDLKRVRKPKVEE